MAQDMTTSEDPPTLGRPQSTPSQKSSFFFLGFLFLGLFVLGFYVSILKMVLSEISDLGDITLD